MKIVLAGTLLILPAPAFAQPQQPAPYTLTLTPEQVVTIGDGLNELPAKRANPVLVEIQRQITAQNQKASPPSAPAPAPSEPKVE